jgi:hypothetical protein
MSTIRFRDLVKTSGKPEPKSLWTDPKHDRQFMHAVKANRVLTVVQPPASKKTDFGEIGFHQQPHSSYFVFPKPLPANEGKVVGIKYDLVEQSKPADALSTERLHAASASSRRKSPRAKIKIPVEKTFEVQVRRMAVAETNISVQARTKEQAKQKAIEVVKNQEFDTSKEEVSAKVVRKR